MKKILTVISFLGWGALAIQGVGGCGGGGSVTRGAASSGLEIADQMALVTAADGTGSSSLSALASLTKFAAPIAGDYITDVPNIYVFDESMEAMDMINE